MQLGSLGAGSFGECKLAIDKSDGEKVAVKFIQRGARVRTLGRFVALPLAMVAQT